MGFGNDVLGSFCFSVKKKILGIIVYMVQCNFGQLCDGKINVILNWRDLRPVKLTFDNGKFYMCP